MRLPARIDAGTVFAAAAFILAPLAVFAPLGAAPLMVAGALAVLAIDGKRLRPAIFDARARDLAVLFALLGAWALLSSLWSLIPAHSALEGARFLVESACGWVLFTAACHIEPPGRRRIAVALVAGVALALVLLAIERFGAEPIMRWWYGVSAAQGEPLARYDRGVTVLALLIWPIAVARLPPVMRAIAIALIVAAALLLASAAALLAAIIGLIAFAIARFAPRCVAGAMIAGIVALGIAIPVATPSYSAVIALHQHAPWIKWSGIHRLLIWRFAADHVAERPLLGWGMDSSRAIPGGTTDLNTMLPALHYPNPAQALPLHPHDAALQWQLELGIPGLILGLALVARLIQRIGWQARLSPEARAAALGLAAGALVIGLLSFGIWQSWWQATLWLAGSLYAGARTTDA